MIFCLPRLMCVPLSVTCSFTCPGKAFSYGGPTDILIVCLFRIIIFSTLPEHPTSCVGLKAQPNSFPMLLPSSTGSQCKTLYHTLPIKKMPRNITSKWSLLVTAVLLCFIPCTSAKNDTDEMPVPATNTDLRRAYNFSFHTAVLLMLSFHTRMVD